MNNAKARRKAERANRFAGHVSEKIETSRGQEWDSAQTDEATKPQARVPSTDDGGRQADEATKS